MGDDSEGGDNDCETDEDEGEDKDWEMGGDEGRFTNTMGGEDDEVGDKDVGDKDVGKVVYCGEDDGIDTEEDVNKSGCRSGES